MLRPKGDSDGKRLQENFARRICASRYAIGESDFLGFSRYSDRNTFRDAQRHALVIHRHQRKQCWAKAKSIAGFIQRLAPANGIRL